MDSRSPTTENDENSVCWLVFAPYVVIGLVLWGLIAVIVSLLV